MKARLGLNARPWRPDPQADAFTFIELLAVIAIIALLALMLLPARAASQNKSQSLRCLDNLRQVMAAMMMYTHDNHDLFPPNPDGGGLTAGYYWCAGQAYGGMTQGEPPPSPTTFDPDILANPSLCLITTYLNTNTSVFRCTADPRMGLYQGSDPSKVGTVVPATRTISMSCAVGTIDASYASGGSHSGIPNLPVTGVWLDGTRLGNKHNSPWRTYGRTSDMIVPAPSNLIVVTEEDPFSINDGLFATCVAIPEWVDWPSTLHNMGCVVSFGDGHAELHKWHDASTRLTGPASTATLPPTSVDWNWVASRVSAR